MTGGSGLHEPVLVREVLDFLKAGKGGIFADCTLGMGGHAEKILESSSGLRVLGLDCDRDAVAYAEKRLERFGEMLSCIRENYSNLSGVLEERGIRSVDGILLDLGLSSAQLADESRGFSFMKDAPLDMRMDRGLAVGAGHLVNRLPRRELAEIFKKFGEEPRAEKIAGKLVMERKKSPVETTGRLAEIISKAYGGRGRIHPATRVFQALRIAVNRELEALEKLLDSAVSMLSPGGRLCVISYHSLEDRIVKYRFRSLNELEHVNVLTKKPVVPSREEVLRNRRSRSAKLRVLERV